MPKTAFVHDTYMLESNAPDFVYQQHNTLSQHVHTVQQLAMIASDAVGKKLHTRVQNTWGNCDISSF